MDYVNQRFENEKHVTDGNTYSHCTFFNCTVLYCGGELPTFDHLIMHDSRWGFDGHAYRTLQLIRFISGQGPIGRDAALNCWEFVIGRRLTNEERAILAK
jgi:hypothetical protein